MGDLKFDPDIVRALKFYGTIGFNVSGAMILGFLFGRLLDNRLGTEPLFAISGFLMGAAAGFWGVWKLTLGEFEERSKGSRTGGERPGRRSGEDKHASSDKKWRGRERTPDRGHQ